MDMAETVYDSLCGQLREDCRIPDVEDMFAENTDCDRYYKQMQAACNNLCNRLGVEEDPDVEQIIQSWMLMMEKVGLRMYHYGVKFSRE